MLSHLVFNIMFSHTGANTVGPITWVLIYTQIPFTIVLVPQCCLDAAGARYVSWYNIVHEDAGGQAVYT